MQLPWQLTTSLQWGTSSLLQEITAVECRLWQPMLEPGEHVTVMWLCGGLVDVTWLACGGCVSYLQKLRKVFMWWSCDFHMMITWAAHVLATSVSYFECVWYHISFCFQVWSWFHSNRLGSESEWHRTGSGWHWDHCQAVMMSSWHHSSSRTLHSDTSRTPWMASRI